MELKDSVLLPVPANKVWQALNDPDVLRLCIPGCEEVKQISPEEMHATVKLRLGPIQATFVGKVRLTDVRPLQGCTLNFEGSGGSAGFAKGNSVIALSAVPEGTRLDYTATATVAGKLGQIGGRLMDVTAKQLADRFFAAFKNHLSGGTKAALPVVAVKGPGALPVALSSANARASADNSGWFQLEKSRLVWFFAGVLSTLLGVWMGAHFLR
jgi:carbon monoxide dehydrogenase subunit G